MHHPRSPRYPVEAILYCASCDSSLGAVKAEHLGLHFICPNEEDWRHAHFARVIIDSRTARSWLRWERLMLEFQNRYSPFPCLQRILPTIDAGFFVLLSTILLLAAIFAWPLLSTRDPILSVPVRVLLLGFVLWRFVDIFVTNISITFTSRFPANPIRSVLYSLVAYVQVALSFAFFYVALGKCHFSENVDPASTIFFSFTTIATVGYGDLKPKTAWALVLVILELVSGLFFVAIVLAQVAGWAIKSRREEGDYSIEDLK